jgi:hypothetical protein
LQYGDAAPEQLLKAGAPHEIAPVQNFEIKDNGLVDPVIVDSTFY